MCTRDVDSTPYGGSELFLRVLFTARPRRGKGSWSGARGLVSWGINRTRLPFLKAVLHPTLRLSSSIAHVLMVEPTTDGHVETALGRLRVRCTGPEDGVPFLAIPSMAGNPKEWDPVAGSLARTGLRVVVPAPYSMWSSWPSVTEFAVVRTVTTLFGMIHYRCREVWMADVVQGPFVLAGFSWGGGAAARYAAAHPENVSKLVLVSPDVEYSVAQRLAVLNIPTLLLWDKYDPANPVCWTRRFRGHPSLTIHHTDEGGHRVLDSHAEVIARWLRGEEV